MQGNKIRLLVPLLLAAGLAAGTVSAQAAPARPAAVGDVQLVTVGFGHLNHTIRFGNNGSWQPFGQLTNSYNGISGLTSAIVNGEEHVFFQYVHQSPFYVNVAHFIRHIDGTWNLDGSVPNSQETPPTPLEDSHLAAANVNGVLHLVRLHNGTVQNSVQNTDGTWTAWADAPFPGTFNSISATGNGSDLRVVAATTDGTTLVESDHHADGTWSPARQTPFTTDIGLGHATSLSVAQVGDDLQVVARGDNSNAYHSMMHLNGSWDLFGNVSGPAGYPGSVISVAVAASRGELQLVVGTADGSLMHTIRHADRSWQGYGSVTLAAGQVDGFKTPITLAGQ